MLNKSQYRILAIGKIRKPWIQEGVNSYKKRMPGLTIIELRDSNPEKETQSIFSLLRKGEKVVCLTEEGEFLSSIAFSNRLKEFQHQRIAFIIGGANGLPPKVKNFASWQFSLSNLTFPHELAQLLLIEQIYRAQMIQQGSPYHR